MSNPKMPIRLRDKDSTSNKYPSELTHSKGILYFTDDTGKDVPLNNGSSSGTGTVSLQKISITLNPSDAWNLVETDNGNYYTQSIEDASITADTVGMIDVSLDEDYATSQAQLNAYNNIYRVSFEAGVIKVYSLSQISISLTLIIQIFG